MFLSALGLVDLSHDISSWFKFLKVKKKPKVERDGFVSVISTIVQMITFARNKASGKIYWYSYLWTFLCLVSIGLFTFIESYSLTYLSIYIIPLMLNAIELNDVSNFYSAVTSSLYAAVAVFVLRAILSAIAHGTKSRMVRDLRNHMHTLDADRVKQRLNNQDLDEDVSLQLGNDPFERLVGHAPGILKVALSFSVNLIMAIMHLRTRVVLSLVLMGIMGSMYCQKASRWLVSARKAHFDSDNAMSNHASNRDLQTIGNCNAYESANKHMFGLIKNAQKFTFIKNFCDSLLDNITTLCKNMYVVFLYWFFGREVFSGARTLSQVILDIPFGVALANHAADGIGLFMMARNMAADISNLKSSWNQLTPEYPIYKRPLRPHALHTAYIAAALILVYSVNPAVFFTSCIAALMITLCAYMAPTSSIGMLINYIFYGMECLLTTGHFLANRLMGKRRKYMDFESISPIINESKVRPFTGQTHAYTVNFDGKEYNMSFNLDKGKVHFISGKNGAGKTYCFAHIVPNHFVDESLTGLYDYNSSLILNGNIQMSQPHTQPDGSMTTHAHRFADTFGLTIHELKEQVQSWYQSVKLEDLIEFDTLMRGLNSSISRNVFSLGQQKVIIFIAAVHKAFKNGYEYLCIDEALYGVPNHITSRLYQQLVNKHNMTLTTERQNCSPTISIIHHDYDASTIKGQNTISQTYTESGNHRSFS